jgi:hypothetical protein
MHPTQLSRERREGRSPDLTRRRRVEGLALLGDGVVRPRAA